MKGQMTIANLIGLFVVFIMLTLVVLPVLNPIIEDSISTNNFTGSTAALLRLIPPALVLCMIISAVMIASFRNPNQR